jgi:Calcium binding
VAKKQDKTREDRIEMEIVVDANGPEERAMGWYYYLEDKLSFPFTAHCTAQRAVSPLRKGDEIEVLGMAPEDECQHEMFVMIRWDRKEGLAVPLAQLKPVGEADDATRQAVADWLYWVQQKYEF